MDYRAHEPACQVVHGLVTPALLMIEMSGIQTGMCPRPAPRTSGSSTLQLLRGALAMAIVLSLVGGLTGGLLRAGVVWPTAGAGWIGTAGAAHGFLMVCGFMGTVVGIERAAALKHRWAFAAPVASAAAGLAMLGGAQGAAAVLVVLSGLAFVAVNVKLVLRQAAPHTALLLLAAVAWLAGNALFAADAGPVAVLPWWFSFLLITIAAERLEMTRLMRRRPAAATLLNAALVAMLLGSALSALQPRWGGVLYGAALVALAAWLLVFDIARRTVHAPGLSRYMALCLLLGYGWLALAGAAWCAAALGLPLRDAALHALALGFVFSMMLGHAPVILPALARIKLQFGWPFYLPLALLHGSLLLRLLGPHFHSPSFGAGATGNALAIALFAATVAGAALLWRSRHPR